MPLPPFLEKLYEIFSEPKYADICGLGKNNDTIFIRNMEEFESLILPKYFRHSKFLSFTRQLHKYDFHKTVHNPHHAEFRHPLFRKDRPDLLESIKRKKYISKKKKAELAKAQLEKEEKEQMENSFNTDAETDVSSLKDDTSDNTSDNTSDKTSEAAASDYNEMDDEFDDYMSEEDCASDGLDMDVEDYDMDFEQYDEIEASVERGLIGFDSDRLSYLEKRQADLFEENENFRNELTKRNRYNNDMIKAMDNFIHSFVVGVDEPTLPDDVHDSIKSKHKIRPDKDFKLSDSNVPSADGLFISKVVAQLSMYAWVVVRLFSTSQLTLC